jgi:hypothetical protein
VKKYDPLWELVDEKIPLKGAEKDVDTRCPECHVILHVSSDIGSGDPVECGLCGAALTVEREGDEVRAQLRG